MKKKSQPSAHRSLVARDMLKRGAYNGGRMRDRRSRRILDARHDEVRIQYQAENDLK